MSEIVRFAPSPTGYLHVGGARTAIFNWIIARQSGGTFLLRIEDTDRLRSTADSIQQIIRSMEWLGLDWDGEIVYQSRRLERHKERVTLLLEKRKAYRCFCTKEDLAARRREAEKKGETFRYDRRCLSLSDREISARMDEKKPFSIRLHIPDRDIVFTDLIHGPTTVSGSTLDDFIIQREDGTPVYQMAVVADDYDMGVTLVLRGDDHLSNTPKQLLIYEALGWPAPGFGHIPLILGPDKVRLSKRHGAASIEEFRELGILPDALFNYLCLLGWATGDDSEYMSRDEIVQRFEITRINKGPAVFDQQKLRWMNRKYLTDLPLDRIKPWITARLQEKGIEIDTREEHRFDLLMELMKQRAYTTEELLESLMIYSVGPSSYDEKGIEKFFNEKGAQILHDLAILISGMSAETFEHVDQLETRIREFAGQRRLSAGKVIHPLRLALTGKTESPGIFEMLYILGREKVSERIEKAVRFITDKPGTNAA